MRTGTTTSEHTVELIVQRWERPYLVRLLGPELDKGSMDVAITDPAHTDAKLVLSQRCILRCRYSACRVVEGTVIIVIQTWMNRSRPPSLPFDPSRPTVLQYAVPLASWSNLFTPSNTIHVNPLYELRQLLRVLLLLVPVTSASV